MAGIGVVAGALPSHLIPIVPLLRELKRRGHTVTVAAPAGLDVPAAALSSRFSLPLPGPVAGTGDPVADVLAALHRALDDAIASLPVLLERWAAVPCDLLLHDTTAWVGPVVAAMLGIPTVQTSAHPVAWDGFEDGPGRLDELRDHPEHQRLSARVAAWADGLAVALPDGVAARPQRLTERPRRGLAAFPRALQPHADRVADAWSFVAMRDREREAARSWTPPDSGRPVVLVSSGTLFHHRPELHRAALEAFADGGWHVVLDLGPAMDPGSLGPVPPWVELHRRAPQLAVLDHAACFVTHAGAGSATEALFRAVPMVALPAGAEQALNADTLAALGAAWLLPAWSGDPVALRRAVDGVAGEAGGADRRARLAADLEASGGVDAAVEVVLGELPAGA